MPHFSHLSILIAHGAPQHIAWLVEALRPVAQRITVASTEEMLAEALQNGPPDVLLVDEGLPPRGGLAACEELRRHTQHQRLPIVALLRPDSRGSALRAYEAGCDDALALPADLRTLTTRVAALARLHQGRKVASLEAGITALLQAVEARDPATRGHGRRIASLAYRLGQRCGLSPSACQTVWLAGLAHDIGKLGFPDHLLLGTTPLTPSDWELIRQHPLTGEAICRPLAGRTGLAEAVRHHHERWDGKGYPDALLGEAVPLFARILAVVDAYDAITSDRPYRAAAPPAEALGVMRQEAGRQFDPVVTTAFVEMARVEGL